MKKILLCTGLFLVVQLQSMSTQESIMRCRKEEVKQMPFGYQDANKHQQEVDTRETVTVECSCDSWKETCIASAGSLIYLFLGSWQEKNN